MTTSIVAQLVVWLIIGGLAGSVAGMIVRPLRGSLGWFWNLLLGMAGALLGGWLFDLLNIDLGALSQIAVAFDQIIAAVIGSLLVLLGIFLFQRVRARQKIAE